MNYSNIPLLIIDPALHTQTGSEHALEQIMDEFRRREQPIIESGSEKDATQIFLKHPEIGCILIEWDMKGCSEVIKEIRAHNDRIPIFIMTEKHKLEEIPTDLIEVVMGYIWKMEDTPHFIAGRIEEATAEYIDALLPPFFGELMHYVEEYKYAWHTPGHMGGLAFFKSPVGRLFYNFFGENIFRADLSVSVPELGSLMEHTGVNLDAEKHAAKVFGADYTYFVTNGTSTANKIINHSLVTHGDIALIDRNCHKSLQHAITMTGAIPIYLIPERNAYGIIGGISHSEFDSKTLTKKIQDCPLIEDKQAPIKLAVITNSTYDGLIYDVTEIKEKLKNSVSHLHFDEAWYGYANFNPIYANRHAMTAKHNPDHPTTYASQSTHKVLAAFSQASMIHIKKGKDPFNPDLFNEAFMMHTSTSPQYTIIASLDVAAKMMEGKMGQTLVQDSIDESIVFRKKMKQIKKEKKDWWFDVWQPGSIDTTAKSWTLKKGEEWHGYPHIENEFMMLDPIKVTFLTPGMNPDGTMDETGIPAPLVAKFLMRHGVVDEKTGFYTFLALFTIGMTKGKSSILLSALFDFKEAYDNNAPLSEVFPDLTQPCYQDKTLPDLAQEMHTFLKEKEIAKITNDVFSILPEPVLSPSDAYANLVRGNVKEVTLDNLQDETLAVMLVPYPPGIPIVMPGEKCPPDIVSYLKTFEEFDNRFPGFETETHGVEPIRTGDRVTYQIPIIQQ